MPAGREEGEKGYVGGSYRVTEHWANAAGVEVYFGSVFIC